MCYNIKVLEINSTQKGRCFILTRKFSVIYKILTALVLLTGITLNLSKTSNIVSLLSYYTFQSNIICFIAFVTYTVIEIREKSGKCIKGDMYYFVKGAVVIMIFITTFCYHIALAPQFDFDMGFKQTTDIYNKIANFFVHTLSPCLVILDYFLFDEKGNFKKYYPFLWLCFPLNYVLYVYIYASQGGTFYNIGGSQRFAYFFLDYIEIGVSGVIYWIIGMILGILLASYMLVIIDRILGKRSKS